MGGGSAVALLGMMYRVRLQVCVGFVAPCHVRLPEPAPPPRQTCFHCCILTKCIIIRYEVPAMLQHSNHLVLNLFKTCCCCCCIRYEVLAMLQHSNHLEAEYGAGPHTISVPRLRPADGSELSIRPPYEVGHGGAGGPGCCALSVCVGGCSLMGRLGSQLDRLLHGGSCMSPDGVI